MGHGSVAEEIKRRRERRTSMILSIEEEGVRFRSYLDGAERFMGPETSMEVQAALGSDIALAFDECTPFHVERDYTASSMERTHRWLDRCVDWHREHAPAGTAALRDRPGRGLRGPARAVDRLRGLLRRARDRDRRVARPVEGADARGSGLVAARAAGRAAPPPARDRRRGRPGPRRRRGHRHASTAPRPHGSRATARRSCTTRPAAGDSTSAKAVHRTSTEPIDESCLPRLPRAHARLPALPDPGRRADRQAADHAPQPHLHGAS